MAERNIRIRPASIDDLDALLPLVQAYRVFYRQEPQTQRERIFMDLRLRTASSTVYIAEVDGMMVAFMQLFKTYSTVHLAGSYILEDLFVSPAYRALGIATQLLERAKNLAEADGASGLFLETAIDNETAQRVYERAGWTRENRFYKYNAPLRHGSG